ncbi:DUF397 domain-containing protein [Streptomyces somaliensis]|uniref:DUF397 domain-containing protein n=1 Tax=Streptomyces somaliensis TaxID=78355 RepID=UPI0020CF49D1|nr:DUF397 domain-containing protein [Streptomyces somaliensis]MCP9944975.1 DUF397 domain-containing protein [Streptomyces somaliensis]MCP9961800.1 DUF397 domain-containing protein [Streptomyces somaliensis]MCP9974622.1 DUF397 domain-containing protein [Streptomyces somaliensis]
MMRDIDAQSACEPAWFKSSHSDGPEGDSCVEIAIAPGTVHVRDSKDADGPRLAVAPGAWAGFVAYASRY